MTGTPPTATSVEAILAATRRVIAERGPEKLRMSAIAAAAGVSRPTLYHWFPSKDELLEALTVYEEELFDARLQEVIAAQRSAARQLDAALRLPGDLPRRPDGPGPDRRRPGVRHPVAGPLARPADGVVRPGPRRRVRVVPAVRQRRLTREQAAELFLRVAKSHYLIPHPEPEVLLANLRSFAGLRGGRRQGRRLSGRRPGARTRRGGSDVDSRRGDRRSARRAPGSPTWARSPSTRGWSRCSTVPRRPGRSTSSAWPCSATRRSVCSRPGLSVEDWYRRHPEIDDQEIVAAAVRPRAAAHRLDRVQLPAGRGPRGRVAAGLGGRRPDPATGPGHLHTDPRIAESAGQIALIDEMAPKFKTMLPSSPTGPTECLQILALDFRSVMFGALGDNRRYEAWMAGCDMASAYRYHRAGPEAAAVAVPRPALAAQGAGAHGLARRPRSRCIRRPAS